MNCSRGSSFIQATCRFLRYFKNLSYSNDFSNSFRMLVLFLLLFFKMARIFSVSYDQAGLNSSLEIKGSAKELISFTRYSVIKDKL